MVLPFVGGYVIHQRPIFPQGKIVCSISPYNEENKEFSFSSEEQGTVDGVAYHLSHGRVVAGYIGDGLFSWEMECENRKSKNNDSSAKFCYVKDLQFYVQYIPELKEINVPKGYVISHGRLISLLLPGLWSINKKSLLIQSYLSSMVNLQRKFLK